MAGKPRNTSRARAQKDATKTSKALDALRTRIDQLDQRLVELLNERSRLVVKVGKHKRDRGIPIYAPHREAQVLQNVLNASKGPLSARATEGSYRELMTAAFALEQP